MLVIDADTHIDETENTWEYLREKELQFKPTTGYPAKSDPSRRNGALILAVMLTIMLVQSRASPTQQPALPSVQYPLQGVSDVTTG